MKTLETTATNFTLVWNNLRNAQPKDFRSVEEMELSVEICKTIETDEHLKPFIAIIQEMEQVAEKNGTPEFEELRADLEKRSKALEKEMGETAVSMDFEKEEFQILFQFCERWGRYWFAKVPDYLKFRKDLNDANGRAST